METAYIQSKDARIYIECYGNEHQPVLVLLHGNGEDLHYFDPQIAWFSENYRMITIDSRSHGKSTRGTSPLDFNTLANDVLSVLNALHIQQAHILGFSDGANTALHLALIAPERITSMILLGGNYSPSGLRPMIRLSIISFYLWLTIASLFSDSAKKKKEIWELMVWHPNLTIEDVSHISIPTLIITGENDMVTQKQNDEMHQAIAGSERIIIPKADHFLSCKMPQTFNQLVDTFLKKCNFAS